MKRVVKPIFAGKNPVVKMLAFVHLSIFFFLFVSNIYVCLECPQHDDLEPNLKKIPQRNGIWRLEAIVM